MLSLWEQYSFASFGDYVFVNFYKKAKVLARQADWLINLVLFSHVVFCVYGYRWFLLSSQLRQALDTLLNDMKNLPARLKQYASFEFVQKTIKTYLKVNNFFVILCSVQ